MNAQGDKKIESCENVEEQMRAKAVISKT